MHYNSSPLQGCDTADQHGIFSRLGGWFKRVEGNGDLPLQGTLTESEPAPDVQPIDESPALRSTFLRPWAKRDAAIENLQNGVSSLGELMSSIQDSLQRNGQRQDEMLQYLSHLPQALQQLPEISRMQGETLKVIHRRMEQQSSEQSKLADVLERMSQADAAHGRTLEALEERVDSVNEHEERMSQNLNTVGSALQSVSRNSEATSAVLLQIKDHLSSRNGEMERVLQRQGVRFTSMLAVAIFLSISALAAVSVFGYLMLNTPR